MDSPAHLGTSRSQAPGRRLLAQRLLPARGCELRRYASAWRPFAPPPAGRDVHSVPLHVQFHDRAYFDLAIEFKNRTALGELGRLIKVFGNNQGVAADHVFGFGKRTVVDGFALACFFRWA